MVKKWIRVGEPRELAGYYKKHLVAQLFIDCEGHTRDWTLFRGENRWSVIVLPITEDRMVVAIEEFKFGSGGIEIELPCGNREGEETPYETAQRELQEETGYRSKIIIPLMPRQQIWIDSASSDGFYYPFLMFGCEKKTDQILDPTENIEVKLIPLAEWLRMSLGGEMSDAKSIVTTHKALPYLKKEFGIQI